MFEAWPALPVISFFYLADANASFPLICIIELLKLAQTVKKYTDKLKMFSMDTGKT
jgi:hypothetical protein